MEKLKNYIENVFASLPKTKEVVEMKLNMLEHMQDKYNELVTEGKNENEAFGIVVADFGSIEEIKAELGITDAMPTEEIAVDPALNAEYTAFRKKFTIAITSGVALCLLGVIVLLAIESIFGENSNIPVIIFLFFIMVAVAIFVYFGMQNEKYEKLHNQGAIKENKEKNQKAEAICGAIMLSATAIFLLAGFLCNAWHPAWVVFPVGGIVCGIIKTLFGIEKQCNN